MSATQTAVFIVSAVLAVCLAAIAVWLVLRTGPRFDKPGAGVTALCVGVLAALVFGVGACTANGGVKPAEPGSRCQAGTYDNGAPSGGQPYCVQWR